MPKLGTRHEYRCIPVVGLVQHEVVNGFTLVIEPPVVEEERPVAMALHALEELLRDDLVGVDAGAGERRHLA